MGQIKCSDIERLLKDSRDSTLTPLDELCFIRLVLRCLESGLSYDESIQSCHEQLERSINDE